MLQAAPRVTARRPTCLGSLGRSIHARRHDSPHSCRRRKKPHGRPVDPRQPTQTLPKGCSSRMKSRKPARKSPILVRAAHRALRGRAGAERRTATTPCGRLRGARSGRRRRATSSRATSQGGTTGEGLRDEAHRPPDVAGIPGPTQTPPARQSPATKSVVAVAQAEGVAEQQPGGRDAERPERRAARRRGSRRRGTRAPTAARGARRTSARRGAGAGRRRAVAVIVHVPQQPGDEQHDHGVEKGQAETAAPTSEPECGAGRRGGPGRTRLSRRCRREVEREVVGILGAIEPARSASAWAVSGAGHRRDGLGPERRSGAGRRVDRGGPVAGQRAPAGS